MTDAPHTVESLASPGSGAGGRRGKVQPKRRGKPHRAQAFGKLVGIALIFAMIFGGLSIAYYFRQLGGNLNGLDVDSQLARNRPTKGPDGPLNILIMGSDSRDGEGNNIDGLTGGGQRSDTTLLLHVSADRQSAYGVSIPRDSLVQRPECYQKDGDAIPGGYAMWNVAFSIGGPACTLNQVEALTGVFIDHFVVVDFNGFKGMVDAIDGVTVCLPKAVNDPAHGIFLPAGTHTFDGAQSLKYVRERYTLSVNSDLGRMKRQQAFVASMINKVMSKGMLAHPIQFLKFLNAATKSLTVDKDLDNMRKLAGLGYELRNADLAKIRFVTVPNGPAPEDPNRLVWTTDANLLWQAMAADKPLPKIFKKGAIGADDANGHGNGKDESDREFNGLCA